MIFQATLVIFHSYVSLSEGQSTKIPTENQEGVMLSCCKGSLLNAEEAAPGGGEWSVDKRENNTFCWVSIPMGFSTDIYIYIFWPLTKLTMSCSTLQHHFPARKCLQFLQGLHGHELERGCLLPESSWHQVRQPPGGVGPILTG